MDRSWEYLTRSQTHKNVEIGTEAVQFLEKEYINVFFVAVYRTANLCSLAGRYDNPMPEVNFIPSFGDYEFGYWVLF